MCVVASSCVYNTLLFYINAKIYNKNTRAIIDSGVIENYINKWFLKTLGISDYKKE